MLDRYLNARQGEALALLEQRTGAGRAVTGAPAVWLAARAERTEMLVVEHTLVHPARLSSDGDFLEPAEDVEHPDVSTTWSTWSTRSTRSTRSCCARRLGRARRPRRARRAGRHGPHPDAPLNTSADPAVRPPYAREEGPGGRRRQDPRLAPRADDGRGSGCGRATNGFVAGRPEHPGQDAAHCARICAGAD